MKFNKKYKNINIILDINKFISGILLIILGLFMPLLINVGNLNIYEYLYSSLNNNNQGLLILSAIRLVLLNGIRGLPHYLGTFLFIESIDIKYYDKKLNILKKLIAPVIIPLVYMLISKIHGIKYDFGVPAFIVVFFIIYLEIMDYSKISLLKKSLILSLMLLGVQWLDVIPALSKFKFGRGETSMDIKIIAKLINAEEILTIISLLFFSLFTVNSLLFTKLINDENKIVLANEKKKKMEEELIETRMQALEARNYVELKLLVHDLKTPLTSIQALASVIGLMQKDPKTQAYMGKIEDSIDNLSDMISEILYKEKKKIISTEELFNYILAQISHLHFSSNVIYINTAKDDYIYVNKIRFSRAIINALDNSYNALKDIRDKITIYIYNIKEKIIIEINDEGVGIKKSDINKISEIGYSSRQSTGLGFSFIEDVIKDHNGEIEIKSIYDVGTSLKISLLRVDLNG